MFLNSNFRKKEKNMYLSSSLIKNYESSVLNEKKVMKSICKIQKKKFINCINFIKNWNLITFWMQELKKKLEIENKNSRIQIRLKKNFLYIKYIIFLSSIAI